MKTSFTTKTNQQSTNRTQIISNHKRSNIMDYINTRFSFDEKGQDNAKIKVIGVGGGGGNAVNNMISKGLTAWSTSR
jgi:cell division GTPase FtsZ